jgi:putative addiction module CopG family antidote
MANRIVSLTPDLYDFVQTEVESGRYESVTEVMQAALNALHREEKNSRAQSQPSSIAEGDVFRKLWEASQQSTQLARPVR